jgi:hypothetical protein
MKNIFVNIVIIILLGTSYSYSQQQQPFVFTLYGGLFFPSYPNFRATYQSSSDIVWGGGICLPVHGSIFATGDISFFNPKGLEESSTDSTIELSQRFVHVGILSKQLLSGGIFIRLSGGLSYISIKQTVSSSRSPQSTQEADKKIGYFGGIGFEEPLDAEGRASLFGDAIYDYRRSQKRELYGDFGGIRFILGVHLFLF